MRGIQTEKNLGKKGRHQGNEGKMQISNRGEVTFLCLCIVPYLDSPLSSHSRALLWATQSKGENSNGKMST